MVCRFADKSVPTIRNYPGYFKSETYQLVKSYGRFVLEIIVEGIKAGEIRDDISPSHIRQVILGGIEYLCLPSIIFDREIAADSLTEDLCENIFEGIVKRKA